MERVPTNVEKRCDVSSRISLHLYDRMTHTVCQAENLTMGDASGPRRPGQSIAFQNQIRHARGMQQSPLAVLEDVPDPAHLGMPRCPKSTSSRTPVAKVMTARITGIKPVADDLRHKISAIRPLTNNSPTILCAA
jgi:hypothetical protein